MEPQYNVSLDPAVATLKKKEGKSRNEQQEDFTAN